MEKQKIDRMMQMILTNETLKEQYKENPRETVGVMMDWLDAEEKGVELDPYYSRKQTLEFTIQKLKNDLNIYKEKGNVLECEFIAREILIKRRQLSIIGNEQDYPGEVAAIKEMQDSLNEDRMAIESNNKGPRL